MMIESFIYVVLDVACNETLMGCPRFSVFHEFHQFIKGGGLATRFDVFHKFGRGRFAGLNSSLAT